MNDLRCFVRFYSFARQSVHISASCTIILGALGASLVLAPNVSAQTATSGTILGTVTDPSGALVPRAEVQLVNTETNVTSKQSSNDAGQYVFPNVTPGIYRITVTKTGFRTSSVPNLTVEVNKSYNMPISLEVGAANQVVEVVAANAVALQTTDAQIGNSITTDSILRLPTLQRNVTELMNLQPGVYSTTNGSANSGTGLQIRTTGAIEDQNTVTIDGIDITQSVIAAGTVVPTPADSVEEFRVNVANPNASYDRASGGQITLIGRHGTNTLHGAGYWYRQDTALNANTWDNNHAHIPKAAIEDNRFGGRLSGPIIKDKTFIFGNYEGRRFDSVAQVNRTVPTDTLKQGIVRFRDSSGNVVNYSLATASVCGTAGTAACDPRGLGISPSVKALWSLLPASNITGGDGLNTGGYLANIGTPIQDDYGVLRLDHIFNEKLTFNGNYTYFRHIATGSNDIQILNGKPQSVVSQPQRGAVMAGGLTWQISPTLLNVFRFGYVKDTNAGQATSPTIAAGRLNIPGTSTAAGPIALLAGSGVTSFIDSPIDMDTQRARFQANYNKDFQWIDDMTWIGGSHTIQFGAQFHALPYTHVRADKVLGSITSLVALVDGDQNFLTIPAANRPQTCGGTITTNCLRSSDLTNWDRYYASVLGLVDNVGVLAVRDAQLNPLPFGTNLVNHTNEYATYFYGQDTWRVTTGLTLSFGLSYGWQTAPTEDLGRQTLEIDAGTGQILTAQSFLQAKEQAALKGQVYNPPIGWVPVKQANKPVYNVDYGNVAPRVSVAWNPAMQKGFLGHVFGDRKTVVRGGFALVYDRSNTVQSVEIPMLGVGFGQNVNIQTPSCAATGGGGPGCNAAAGAGNPGASSFRVGVDGTLPLPSVGASKSPVIPSSPFGEFLSFQVDPNTKIGRSYNIDLSIQREIPGGFVLEAAYVGRFARRLPQAINFTQSPYMFVDTASGQSFAKAFDNVATALRSGQTPATQAWFENQLPGYPAKIGFNGTATAYVAQQLRSNFVNGNVSSIFQSLGGYRRTLGLLPYNNDEAQMEFMRTYIGQSNYNGLLVTLSKRLSYGLTASANYTFSRTLDDDLQWQNNASFYPNSFHPGVDYGPSIYDRTHVFNANYVYDLPAGKGHRFSTGNWIDRVIGGWYTSGILTLLSGVPIIVTESSQVFGDAIVLGSNTGSIPINGVPSTGMHDNIGGSNGFGTNGGGANGTGKSLFSNPEATFKNFRPLLLSQDTRSGRANPLRGLPLKNMDMSLGKTTRITERINTRFSADFFNVFNHPSFQNPALSLQNPQAFGVITSSFIPANRAVGARWIELGMRIDF